MDRIADRYFVDIKTAVQQGGMADVIPAFDGERQMKRVAVKLFREGMMSQDLLLETFSRECSSLQELNGDPNIIEMIDFGTDKATGCKFIALSWAPGNLTNFLNDNPPRAWDDFYETYGEPVLRALCFAYSRDILHRDVKPTNVLLDEQGNVRIADFGISKFKKYYRPGFTLAQYGSKPYRPEIDSEEYPDSRDVFGFAVLALDVLSPTPLEEYRQVYDFLDRVELPDGIRAVLSKALSREPEDRQANVEELREEIDQVRRHFRNENKRRLICVVQIAPKTIEVVSHELGEPSHQRVKDWILRDLNEHCGIDRWKHRGEETEHFALLSATLRYQAKVNKASHKLIIVMAFPVEPSRLERLREDAWDAEFSFQISENGQGSASPDAIDWLLDGYQEFSTERKLETAKRAEDAIFDTWRSLLRLKSDIEKGRETPINYEGVEVSGNLLRLNVSNREELNSSVVGQPRMIKTDDNSIISGVVEYYGRGVITLYCETPYSDEMVPRKGRLTYDTRLAETSLQRQFAALDAVKYDRASRADLRKLLTGAQEVRIPSDIGQVNFVHDDLDEDKKAAVQAALGTHDILVVEGPPGTGKTKFIVEVILQYALREGRCRLLLSSQTHTALDNALKNLKRLVKVKGLQTRMARIGRYNDPNISSDVEDLILDNAADDWLKKARVRSQEFLQNWAEEHGISIDLVRTGMVLADLRLARRRLGAAEEDREIMLSLRAELEAENQRLSSDTRSGNAFRDAEERLEVCLRDLTLSEAEYKEAKKSHQTAIDNAHQFPDLKGELTDLDEVDLADLEKAYVEHQEGGEQCLKLISILEEWKDRFGKSSDFHGAYLSGCDVIAGTCLGVAAKAMQPVEFDVCIIDEASKATPTEILVPLSKSKKWIIVGDPNQLPPFIELAEEHAPLMDQHGIDRESAGETMLDHLITILPNTAKTSLLTQHRMVQPIGDLISSCFYGGTLKNVNSNTDPMLAKCLVMPKPVTWFTTSRLEDRHEKFRRRGDAYEYRNLAELKQVEGILLRLQFASNQREKGYDVMLISGYLAQTNEMENLALRLSPNIPDLNIECGTVDRFQGGQADVVIFSVTRSNDIHSIGFLKERRRLNVALSRAKYGLAIVGDSVFCENADGANAFVDILTYIRAHPDDCSLEEVL